MIDDKDIFEIHAGFCKAIANPKRLMIIDLLENQEVSVNEMVERLGISLTNVSQHLRILRDHNIVSTRKEGQSVFYSLSDKRLPEACKKIRAILLEGLVKKGQLLTKLKDNELQNDD